MGMGTRGKFRIIQILIQKKGFGFQSLANGILTCQYLIPLMTYISIRWTNELAPNNGRDLLICLGKYETTYGNSDPSAFCANKIPWSIDRMFCQVFVNIAYLVTSWNVSELFILIRIIRATRSQTRDVKSLLSSRALSRRQK